MRIPRLVAPLLALGLLAAACADSDDTSEASDTTVAAETTVAEATDTTAAGSDSVAPAGDPADFSYALVTPGAVGDGSYTDTAVAGTEQADTELGVGGQIIEALSIAEQETSLRAAVETHPDIVLALSMEADTLLAVAEAFPDQNFGVPSELFADVVPDNVSAFSINVHEGSFLAGVVAGMMTESKTVGAVVGGDNPALNQFLWAYAQGVKAVCTDCTVLKSYLNFEFGDPNLGKEAALAQYGQGADIVWAVAGLSGQGVFEAAKEEGKYAIGVDSNQDADAPGVVITSMMKRTDQTTFLLIKDSLEGNFQSGFTQLSMKDGVVDLSWTGAGSTAFADSGPPEMVAKLPDVEAAVEDYRAQILDGTLEVCDALNAPDTEACTAAKP